jgi:molybdenum cofactor biosynthesis enzyme MoaA
MLQMLYADNKGRMFEHPELLAVGRAGALYTDLCEEETIPFPEGASLVMIPEGRPVGIDGKASFAVMKPGRDNRVAFAVGALLPQGYTRTLLPAYKREVAKPLPLFGYAAVGWKEGTIRVAAVRTDDTEKWNPVNFSTPELKALVDRAVTTHKGNRILMQLSKCALKYNCFTAQNIFYKRWEGGIPVSPTCNARCLGCISLQPAECCLSPQSRIKFIPSADEIIELTVSHLIEAEDGIISFGQGCEGEPSLSSKTVSQAIIEIRQQTRAGTINMNTNAGNTNGIREICEAGIDTLRISTISALESTYTAYYSPVGYTWSDVCSSIAFARNKGVYVSLNLLTFPGLTDQPNELEALLKLVKKHDINMIQFRNLNIDPDYLGKFIKIDNPDIMGIDNVIKTIKKEIPGLEIGNYSKPRY